MERGKEPQSSWVVELLQASRVNGKQVISREFNLRMGGWFPAMKWLIKVGNIANTKLRSCHAGSWEVGGGYR